MLCSGGLGTVKVPHHPGVWPCAGRAAVQWRLVSRLLIGAEAEDLCRQTGSAFREQASEIEPVRTQVWQMQAFESVSSSNVSPHLRLWIGICISSERSISRLSTPLLFSWDACFKPNGLPWKAKSTKERKHEPAQY